MEHLVRVQNEYDRRTLAWLRERVGDSAIAKAAQDWTGPGKPWLSVICRQLAVTPPPAAVWRAPGAPGRGEVGEQHLATIRQILAQPRQHTTRP